MKVEYNFHLQNLCRISKKYYLLIGFVKFCKGNEKQKEVIKGALLASYKNLLINK